MRKGSTIFLQVVIVLIGIGSLALLLWEPHIEGRNAHADLVTIYLRDPFLAYVYVGSLPFFFGLYQAFNLLGCVGQGQACSPGIWLLGTGRSSIGQSGLPVTRSNTYRKPCLDDSATTSNSFPP